MREITLQVNSPALLLSPRDWFWIELLALALIAAVPVTLVYYRARGRRAVGRLWVDSVVSTKMGGGNLGGGTGSLSQAKQHSERLVYELFTTFRKKGLSHRAALSLVEQILAHAPREKDEEAHVRGDDGVYFYEDHWLQEFPSHSFLSDELARVQPLTAPALLSEARA